MNRKVIARLSNKLHRFSSVLSLSLVSTLAFADGEGLEPLKAASDWVMNSVISILFIVLGMVILWQLVQVYFGHKEAREIVKPILITAVAAGVPVAVTALAGLMGH